MNIRYPFPNTRLWKTLFAIYLFLLLYLTRVSQVSHYLLGFYKAQALTFAITGAAVVCFLIRQRKALLSVLLNYRMLIALLMGIAVLAPMCLKRDWTMMYFSVLFSALLGVFISYFLSCRQAAKYYCLLLTALALYSLVAFFLLRPLADVGILPVPTFHNEYGAEFYNFLFSFVSITFARERNFGFFREPGVYQFFLFLALYLCFYQVDWRKEAHMWIAGGILSVTLLSTFATGGVAATALFLLAVYFDKKVYSTPLGRKLTLAFLVLLVLGGAFALWKMPRLLRYFQMMLKKIQPGNPSSDDRLESIRFNLYVIQWTPFVGRTVSYILESVAHNTSSTTILIGILGVLGGSVNLLAWIVLVCRGKGKWYAKLVSLLTLAITFNTQNLISDPFLWIFPMMATVEALGSLWGRSRNKRNSVHGS